MRVELAIPLQLDEILKSLEHKWADPSINNMTVYAISTDSRDVQEGDVFFAFDGEHHNGESFAEEATRKGGVCVCRNRLSNCVQVESTGRAILQLAKYYKSRLSKLKYTVAVTGSVGKSTTKEFVARILSQKYKLHATAGNYNNYLGVSLSVLCAPSDTEALVLELGMNHTGEISELSKCINPDLSIITNIGSSHIGNLGSRENIARAKLEILDGMAGGHLLVPYGEPLLNVAGAIFVANNSSLSDTSLSSTEGGLFSFRFYNDILHGIKFKLSGDHIHSDLALAISAAFMAGLSGEEIKSGVESINSEHLRQRFIRMNGYTIFEDSYNSSYESVIADFIYMKKLGFRNTGAMLGDILELGEEAEAIHRMLGKAAHKYGLSSLFLIGQYARCIADGALECGYDPARIFINDTYSADLSMKQIKKNHLDDELILFKASHRLRLDKIADALVDEERNENGG